MSADNAFTRSQGILPVNFLALLALGWGVISWGEFNPAVE